LSGIKNKSELFHGSGAIGARSVKAISRKRAFLKDTYVEYVCYSQTGGHFGVYTCGANETYSQKREKREN
jgi:hypothetical protein